VVNYHSTAWDWRALKQLRMRRQHPLQFIKPNYCHLLCIFAFIPILFEQFNSILLFRQHSPLKKSKREDRRGTDRSTVVLLYNINYSQHEMCLSEQLLLGRLLLMFLILHAHNVRAFVAGHLQTLCEGRSINNEKKTWWNTFSDRFVIPAEHRRRVKILFGGLESGLVWVFVFRVFLSCARVSV